MPWKATCAMNERVLFIADYERGNATVSELCRRYGISRRNGYKWIARYEDAGAPGLEDRSHAPHRCPHRVSAEIAEELLKQRVAHPTWGPRKILAYLENRSPTRPWPAASTVGELFTAHGLTVHRKKRRRVPASAPFASCVAANDVWTVDFKGWFRTGDGSRCDPLTMSDAATRYFLRCQVLERTGLDGVWPVFDAAFREFGLPKRIRSDNGPPFASLAIGGLSQLGVRLIKCGIVPERIAPGKPQQNGRHERLHLTLKRETASPPAATLRAQQRAFDRFRRIYNEERPHEALGDTTPAQNYEPSPRHYSDRLREPEYGDGRLVRRVRSNGEIKWRGELVFLSSVLAGERVACEECENGNWYVYYGPLQLGVIDYGRRRVRSSPVTGDQRGTHGRSPMG